jgi:hypothetical protein
MHLSHTCIPFHYLTHTPYNHTYLHHHYQIMIIKNTSKIIQNPKWTFQNVRSRLELLRSNKKAIASELVLQELWRCVGSTHHHHSWRLDI